jgi:HK97 family phage prohead protease/HK97 family phage major capsid protein
MMDKKIFLESSFKMLGEAPANNEPVKIAGYASTTETDRVGDVIISEAWNMGMENFINNPIVLFNHDYDHPIGKVINYRVDMKGLYVEAEIYPEAGTAYDMVKRGVLTTFSVGFQIKDARYEPGNDIFYITAVDLYEISVVSVPANAGAVFELSKSLSSEQLDSMKKEFSTASVEEPTEVTVENNETAAEAETEINPNEEIKQMSDMNIDVAAIAEAAATAAVAKSVEVGTSGAERLVADLEARLADQTKGLSDAVAGLKAELAEKAAELEAMQASKRTFATDGLDYSAKEKAVFAALMAGKSIEATKFGRSVIEKAGPHVSSADFEKEVSTNLEMAIRQQLVVAPLFRSINMTTPQMIIPVNPESGLAGWVDPANYGAAGASGTAATHALTEIQLNARKLATKEFVTLDEEEDAILAIVPFVRDAMQRRMARAMDVALLRGTGANAADPITGLVTRDAASAVTVPVAAKVTANTLIALRKDMGVMGLNPADVVYVVSTEAYFDLLEDTNFMTVDKIGAAATLLTGEVGMVAGSKVLVSGEFEAKAATKAGVVAVYKPNFVIGNHRSLRMDSDIDVEKQSRILVASSKMGFTAIETAATRLGVSVMRWVA